MPESRNRPGHEYHKPADIPSSQRTSGHLLWAVLVAVFAGLITLFAAGTNWLAIIIAAVVGFIIGWVIGKRMEKDAWNK